MAGNLKKAGSVTVVVPAYNSAETIERAIDSILGQEFTQKEIIVVDDGSTDGTLNILSRYGDLIKIIKQKNSGPSAARNRALKIAMGQYIAFLDSDDYWLPGMLNDCITALERAPCAIAASGMTRAIHWSGREETIPATPPSVNALNEVQNFFDYWAAHDHIRTGSVVINSGKAEVMPLFRENLRLSEDLEYWAYLAQLGNWVFVPEVLFVTDGRHQSSEMSWREKNRKRRDSCPSVEEWQERLLMKLKESELSGFQKARGRIARSFAHIKILNGDDHAAKEIVRLYGDDFPMNRLNHIMVSMARRGKIVWGFLTAWLRCRELLKTVLMARPFTMPK